MHACELIRMVDIRVGDAATVRRPDPADGCQDHHLDLSASASLVLAALCTDGETTIDRVYHI